MEELNKFEQEIKLKTFVKGNEFTNEDIEMFKKLHSLLTPLQTTQFHSYPSTIRYFSLLQNLQPIKNLNLDIFTFDFSTFPKPQRVQEAPKQKSKKEQLTSEAPAGTSGGKKGGEKKDKPKKEKNSAPATPAKPTPSMIDLRVGKIVKVEKHPDADSLYVEQIDLGEETGPRTVVSGLVKYVPIEEMQDRLVVAICNLKPASMRGIKSFAMVLCATSSEGKDGGVELINVPEGSKAGDRIYFEGYENDTPEEQLNPKKKVFETIQPNFKTLDNLNACWVNPENNNSVHHIRTSNGICRSSKFANASLS